MSRLIKKIGISAALLCLGAVIGPVLFAAATTAMSVNQEKTYIYTASESALFMENYRNNLSGSRLLLTMDVPPDGKECGYEPDKLFPRGWDDMMDRQLEGKFSNYTGYYVLDRWRGETRDREYVGAVTEALEREVGEFTLGFLRRCRSYTVFSNLCHSKAEELVRTASSGVERFDHNRKPFPMIGFGIEDEIVCTYADGVAARLGLSLQEPARD